MKLFDYLKKICTFAFEKKDPKGLYEETANTVGVSVPFMA
jgi:hypothetical protein